MINKRLRLPLVCTLIMLVAVGAKSRKVTVVDSKDKTPISGAAVFSNSGRILGLTDSVGEVNADNESFPLTITCMGYRSGSTVTDTLALTPYEYELEEVTVSGVDRPATRVLAYAREYYTGATQGDTVIMFSDYMIEFLFENKISKDFKGNDVEARIRNARHYTRKSKADGTEAFGFTTATNGLQLAQLCYIPQSVNVTEGMRNGAKIDVVPGKYGPKYKLQRNGKYLSISIDELSDYKNHTFSPWWMKMFGATTDFNRMSANIIWLSASDTTTCYLPTELVACSYNMQMLCRGKLFKSMYGTQDDVSMEAYIELWPVDVSHLSKDEYKKEKKNETAVPFDADIQNEHPLQPAYARIVERCRTLPAKKE